MMIGYKFETISTLATTWGDASREDIEKREDDVVNNNAQYCSVVRTGIGSTILCLGGEVDASPSESSASPQLSLPDLPINTTEPLTN
jgi:RAT1-interacting protein